MNQRLADDMPSLLEGVEFDGKRHFAVIDYGLRHRLVESSAKSSWPVVITIR
jgi:hypothetical protein